MEERMDNERRNKYIIDRLSSTKIDPVYLPLVATIISRRSQSFNLSDEYFIRDVESFVNNVKTIEVGDLPKGTGNRFYIEEQKIVIGSEWFNLEKFNAQRFFEGLAHECDHAMNFEQKEDGSKQDRTFFTPFNMSTMEAFTECQADEAVFGTSVSLLEDGEHKGLNISSTCGYPEVTHYIDVIAATFGVSRAELLGESIKGQEELQNFLNSRIDIRCQDSNKNKIFEGISNNIGLFHRATSISDPQLRTENVIAANSKIYAFAEQGLDERISDLECYDLETFEEQFNNIKINQKIVKRLIELGASEQICERFREGTEGKFDLVNIKLISIEQILQNEKLEDKNSLIQQIQSMHDIEEITKFIEEKDIPFDTSMDIEDTIKLETIKEYNQRNVSKGWDNSEITEYIEAHKEEIQQTKEKQPSKFKVFIANTILKINSLFDKVGNFTSKLFGKEEQKLLPSGIERFEENGAVADPITSQPKSWELSSYGIDIDEFNEESIRIVGEHMSRENEQTAHREYEESHEIED